MGVFEQYRDNIQETGRSSLLGHMATVVAFSFKPHPERHGWNINAVLYYLDDERFVICLSELPRKDMRPTALRMALGTEVQSDLIAPFAVRELKGMTLEDLPKLKELLVDLSLEWADAL